MRALIAMFVVVPAIAVSAPVRSAAPGYSQAFDTCMSTGSANAGSDPAMEDCSRAELSRRDAELNRLYKALMAKLSNTRAANLRVSERTWLKQRDQKCDAKWSRTSGPLDLLMNTNCILDETIARTIWLKRFR
jgi:uncharacterized protein YecT (DUF1311 family)